MNSQKQLAFRGAIDQRTFDDALATAPFAVHDPTEEIFRRIPASLEALSLDRQTWEAVRRDGALILDALVKLADHFLGRLSEPAPREILAELSPLEQAVLSQDRLSRTRLATVRMDFFFSGSDLRLLEVNATIPAMQAYADMIASAYAEAWAKSRGLPGREVAQKLLLAQSNVDDLLDSLLAHYATLGGRKERPRIAVVARHGDSQLAELRWIQKRWQGRGYEVYLVTPSEIDIKGGSLVVSGIPIDLTYRHIFARRLEEGSAFARALRTADRFRILNPIAAHLEAKGLLAELSRYADEVELSRTAGIHDEARGAIHRRLPWTRRIERGPNRDPSGRKVPDLVEWLKGNPRGIVLKKSHGYGGHGVFFGDTFESDEVQGRVQAFVGTSERVTWERFIDYCASTSSSAWIAQEQVEGLKRWLPFSTGEARSEQDCFVDCSAFLNYGVPSAPRGGAIRFGTDPIVNIGRGGGMAPFLLDSHWEVLSELERGDFEK